MGTLIPIHHGGPKGGGPALSRVPSSSAKALPTACIGLPAGVAGQGGAALVAGHPSLALSPALNAALGASTTPTPGRLVAGQVDVLDASDRVAEVVIEAKNGPGSVGIALHLDLGCVGGNRVVVGANDVSP